MLRYVPAVLALVVSLNCAAELRVKSAQDACTLLTDVHLRAGEWTQGSNGQESCWSAARPVVVNFAEGNRIAYSAEGANGTPDHVKLVVEVVSLPDEDHAKRELVKATKRLSVRALGLSVPYSVEESIMKGLPARLNVGTGTITITRTAVVKGSYQLAVVME